MHIKKSVNANSRHKVKAYRSQIYDKVKKKLCTRTSILYICRDSILLILDTRPEYIESFHNIYKHRRRGTFFGLSQFSGLCIYLHLVYEIEINFEVHKNIKKI